MDPVSSPTTVVDRRPALIKAFHSLANAAASSCRAIDRTTTLTRATGRLGPSPVLTRW